MVLPSSTLSSRLTAPPLKSIADTNEVLPVWEWPVTATLRIESVLKVVLIYAPPVLGLGYQTGGSPKSISAPVSRRKASL